MPTGPSHIRTAQRIQPTGLAGDAHAPACAALVMCLAGILLGLAGCRSAAQQDVYNEKMAGRIRLLEDRLNEADYQNQILRQQLKRAAASDSDQQPASERSTRRDRGSLLGGFGTNDSRDTNDRGSSSYELDPPNGSDSSSDSLVPDISLGNPVGGGLSEDDPNSGSPEAEDTNLVPPPTRALPPRREDLTPPPIELGTPLPPEQEDSAKMPPGQIPTPAGTRDLFPPPPSVPVAAKFHLGLTGVHHADSDEQVDGLYLVVSPVDEKGQHVTANSPLSVVVLDPAREGDAARLGRWDLDPGEVRVTYREAPTPSFQIPILWQGVRPQGDEVAVFIRFTLEDGTQLQTDLMIPLNKPRVVDWRSRELGTPNLIPKRAGISASEVWR